MNKLRNLIVALAFVLLSCATVVAQEAPAAAVDKIEAEKWRADLRYMAEAMPKYHKYLFHSMSRAQFEVLIADLNNRIPGMGRHQIIVEMARIVARVGDGHTNIAPTRDPKIGFRTLPIKLYYFEDVLCVRAATKNYANLIGSSVLMIGNEPAYKAYELVKQLIGRDNEKDLRFLAPFLMTMPEVLHAVGLTSSPNVATFVVENNGVRQTVRLEPLGPVQLMPPDTDLSWLPQDGWIDARDAAKLPTPLWLKDPQNKFWYEYLNNSRALYVQINQIGNKETESLESFSKRLQGFVEANAIDRLILDLRLNRGGNGEFNRPLLRALIKSNKVDQKGKLFILVGRSTWSAAQFLVDALEDYTEALFVGEPTGGKRNSYGDSRRITLPNSGITVRVSTLWWQGDGRDKRQWKSPDLSAGLSFADYRNNVDPALKLALEYVPGKPLSELLSEAVASNNSKRLIEVFNEWRASPINKYASGEAQLNRLGYELLAKKQIDEAIEIFKLNVNAYPDSSNCFDSLGDAYLARGDKELALMNYQRAIEVDPTNMSARDALENLSSQTKLNQKP